MDGIPVLHVPYTFFPDQPGGTEIYVAALIADMRRHGYSGVVAAPAESESTYTHDDVRVLRFKKNPFPSLDAAYGAPDEIAAESFRKILRQVKPRIVHIHAHTAAVSERLADEARSFGAKLFFSYHTPTASCIRGTMMFMGETICDGTLDARRCSMCTLQVHGIPGWAGKAVTNLPSSISLMLGARVPRQIVTALRIPALVAEAHGRFHSLMEKCDRVVAVCQWVMEMLAANGVPAGKLKLCRQGLPSNAEGRDPAPDRNGGRGPGPMRLGYFGRLDPTKGLDVVLDALGRIPHVPLILDVYGIEQPGSADYVSRLQTRADSRVSFRKPVQSSAINRAMAECDFVVVPSQLPETGPLVVYEAFGAGTPVLGSRAGGIAELVADGVDGVLIAPHDRQGWATEIANLAADRDRVARLRNGIRAPRTMRDAAMEMAAHYRSVLASVA
jgi:glycosyltransferase involved in cell wall biosynthesis